MGQWQHRSVMPALGRVVSSRPACLLSKLWSQKIEQGQGRAGGAALEEATVLLLVRGKNQLAIHIKSG